MLGGIPIYLPLLHGRVGYWDEVGTVIGILSVVALLGFLAWSNGNKRRRALLRQRRRRLAEEEAAEQSGDDMAANRASSRQSGR